MRTEAEVNEMLKKFDKVYAQDEDDEQLEGIYEALRWVLGYEGLEQYLPD